MSNPREKSGRFGESSDCCVKKVVACGEEFGGGGRKSLVGRRRDCLEEIVSINGESGPL